MSGNIVLNGTHSTLIKWFYQTGNEQKLIDLIKQSLIEGFEKETQIKFSPSTKKDYDRKIGRILTCSYEAIKYQRIDLFLVVIKQIGIYIARSCKDCVYSDFIIDENEIKSKQWERCRVLIMATK